MGQVFPECPLCPWYHGGIRTINKRHNLYPQVEKCPVEKLGSCLLFFVSMGTTIADCYVGVWGGGTLLFLIVSGMAYKYTVFLDEF